MARDDVLDRDEVEGVLSGSFYSPPEEARARRASGPPWNGETRMRSMPQEKPTQYKVICISMYTKDLERLDELVSELKARGNTKASRSALIRAALEQVDLDKVPRGI